VRRKGRPVAHLGQGAYFGELSLLDRGPHAASVVCTSDVELLVVSRRDFDKVLLSVPTIARKIMRTMASRLAEADGRSYC
jgi:CRP-like cAMP-binding protein